MIYLLCITIGWLMCLGYYKTVNTNNPINEEHHCQERCEQGRCPKNKGEKYE